jgi:hypothetical protein
MPLFPTTYRDFKAELDALSVRFLSNDYPALYLSQAGWRVLVLEQAADIGGAARNVGCL